MATRTRLANASAAGVGSAAGATNPAPNAGKIVEVIHAFVAQERHQISLQQGERVTVLEKDPSGWWIGRNSRGAVGIFPSTYVKDLSTAPPPLEITKEMTAARLVNELGLTTLQSGLSLSTSGSPGAAQSTSPSHDDDDLFACSEEELLLELRKETQRRNSYSDTAQRLLSEIVAEQTDPSLATDPQDAEGERRQRLNIAAKRKVDLIAAEKALREDLEELLHDFKRSGKPLPSGIPQALPAPAQAPVVAAPAPVTAAAKPAAAAEKAPSVKKAAERPQWLAEVRDPRAAALLLDLETQFRRLNEELDGMERNLEHLVKRCKAAEVEADSAQTTAQNREVKERELVAQLERTCEQLAEESKRLKRVVRDQVDAHQQRYAAMEEEARALESAIEAEKSGLLEKQAQLEELKAADATKHQRLEQLRAETSSLRATAERNRAAAESCRKQKTEREAALKQRLSECAAEYRTLERDRRVIYNQIQELKGNLRVYCRLKPCIGNEVNEHIKVVDDMTLSVFDETNLRESSYEFDLVLGEKATQASIFEEVRPLATSVLDGYNVCIFAYGQTGSGKTYTMEGPADNRGVNYRTVRELFAVAQERGAEYQLTISVSVVEVYNNAAFDLQNDRCPVKVRFVGGEQGVVMEPLVKAPVKSADEVQARLDKAYAQRRVAGTNCNEHSSRSHSILTVYVEAVNSAVRTEIRGKLHLIDLAGSERIKASKVEGDRLKEATSINTSLTHLKTVIQALAYKKGHVSYRNSLLTSLLQDSLGGNCKCLMFANISPLAPNIPETICTLKYAAEARKVEVGKVTASVVQTSTVEDQ